MMYLKASTDEKNINLFGDEWVNEAVDHEMDL